ncbi:MAG TPA: hypothetical protein VLJ37_11815 [bacterium]|nr:hypothetical protein [bacterium]
MFNGSLPSQALLARYAALQSQGILNLMRSGGLAEMRALEPRVTRLFEEGRVDLFIRTRDPQNLRPILAPLPRGLSLPSSLTLRGRWSEEPRIDVGGSPGLAYVHTDRIVCTETDVLEDALEAAYHQLTRGAAAMISAAPVERIGSPVLLAAQGGAYVIAARDRGDTHLLVQIRPPVTTSGALPPAVDLPIVDSKGETARTRIHRRLVEKWGHLAPSEVLTLMEAGSAHPALLRSLYRLAEIDRHPQAARALMFLEMICRSGFARAGVRFPPERCPVAVAGFGEEFGTIRILLDHGYPVIAVEDFETPVSSSGRPDITFEAVREAFRDHPHRDRLRVFDFRDPGLPRAQAQVVLFAAAVDEALPTLVHLVRPGGVVAVTDVGQLGWRRQNFFVDSADSFVRAAGREHGARFEEAYGDTLHGPGALPSHFIHPLGHTAYVVRLAPEPFDTQKTGC